MAAFVPVQRDTDTNRFVFGLYRTIRMGLGFDNHQLACPQRTTDEELGEGCRFIAGSSIDVELPQTLISKRCDKGVLSFDDCTSRATPFAIISLPRGEGDRTKCQLAILVIFACHQLGTYQRLLGEKYIDTVSNMEACGKTLRLDVDIFHATANGIDDQDGSTVSHIEVDFELLIDTFKHLHGLAGGKDAGGMAVDGIIVYATE